MRLVTLAAAALLGGALSLAQPAFAQAPGETIDVGGWKIHNQKNDNDSQTCVAMWKYDDDSSVGFGADTNNLTYLIVSEPAVSLIKDRQYEVKYHAGSGRTKTGMAIATSKVMLVLPIPDPDVDFKAFAAAKNIVVEFSGNSYEEPMGGSQAAIKALAQCVASAAINK